MKTLLNIKDELSQGYGYTDWSDLCLNYTYDYDDNEEKIIDEIAKRYAAEAIREAAERASTKKTGNSGSYYDASVDKRSIINLINELK